MECGDPGAPGPLLLGSGRSFTNATKRIGHGRISPKFWANEDTGRRRAKAAKAFRVAKAMHFKGQSGEGAPLGGLRPAGLVAALQGLRVFAAFAPGPPPLRPAQGKPSTRFARSGQEGQSVKEQSAKCYFKPAWPVGRSTATRNPMMLLLKPGEYQ